MSHAWTLLRVDRQTDHLNDGDVERLDHTTPIVMLTRVLHDV